jgi:Uri superfamily endonuclease
MKVCSKCALNKEYIHFYVRAKYADGHSSWCKKCTLDYGKAYKKPRLNERLERQRSWRKDTNYMSNYLSLPQNKIAHNLRTRLGKAITSNISAVKDLGCSIEELKSFLESKFTLGMTWDNYGKWHIDHIKPLSKFNLSDTKELLMACHYTNLQPLWAKDNIVKYNKMENTHV